MDAILNWDARTWTAVGAIVTAVSVLVGLLAQYIQEDLKRTRLRYYLRPMKAPEENHSAAILSVVNVGRTTAKDILCYLSPGSEELGHPSMARFQVETDEASFMKNEGHALIVRFPVLHPSDCFRVLLSWEEGVRVYTRKHKDRFRISYEFGTSNKFLRLFGRVHRFWWWQRCSEAKRDAKSPPSFS